MWFSVWLNLHHIAPRQPKQLDLGTSLEYMLESKRLVQPSTLSSLVTRFISVTIRSLRLA